MWATTRYLFVRLSSLFLVGRDQFYYFAIDCRRPVRVYHTLAWRCWLSAAIQTGFAISVRNEKPNETRKPKVKLENKRHKIVYIGSIYATVWNLKTYHLCAPMRSAFGEKDKTQLWSFQFFLSEKLKFKFSVENL